MTIITKDRRSHIQESEFMEERFDRFFGEIIADSETKYPQKILDTIRQEVFDYVYSREKVEADKLFDLIIRFSNDKISALTPEFTKLSASALRRKLYKQASKNRGFNYKRGYGDYYTFVFQMVEQGIYSEEMLSKYTKTELDTLGKLIIPERDKLFDYAGLYLLSVNYLKKGYKGEILELPQERFLTTAVYLMQNEPKNKRLQYIKEAYWVMSKHYIGQATPTIMNAGTPNGSLSSCHIITPDDDLISILEMVKQSGRFSQNGSGLGIIMSELRSKGSWIRGYKGRASGILHPSRLLSVLAEYVNQLGARNAGIAVYLNVTHYDIFDFLELKLKTGSQEIRAHSIKTAVCLPDEFMRRLRNKDTWTVFDPYEFKKKMGVSFNYLYDKKKLQDGEEPNEKDHAFTYYYRLAEKRDDIEIKRTVKATDIYKAIFTSRKTGGTPYMYYSDTAARLNPNGHIGMPIGSNLCSEIVQNNAPDKILSEIKELDGTVTTKSKGEGLVTCNLSSLVYDKVFTPQVESDLQRISDIQFRMLDNVISLNRTPVHQANHTNSLYRAVGSGGMGLVTYLTNNSIKWESDEAAKATGEIFKKQLKAAIDSSHKLALEKGSYPLFEGSDWQTGAFFDKRGLTGEEWQPYREMASKGMRNGYLQAVAPTSSNSFIMNSSPCIDPPYDVVYREEKSGLSILYVPSNYNNQTKWFYKSGFEMDEMWAINVAASAQQYVDQAISHNMHVSKSIKASELLRLDMGAWDKGLKTTYYTYTENFERPDDCIMCSS